MAERVDKDQPAAAKARVSPWQIVALCASVLGIGLLYALTEACGGGWGWLLAAVCVGCACGALHSSERWIAPTLSGASVGAGSAFTLLVLTQSGLDRLGAHPAYLAGGVANEALTLYLAPMLQSSLRSLGHQPAAFLVAPAVAVGCTLGVRWLVSRRKMPRWSGSAVAMAGLAVVFALGAAQPGVVSWLENPVGGYAYDAVIYRVTYENMKAGFGYYESLLSAAAGDERLINENAVRGNRFYAWAFAPSDLRPPALFYAWKFLTPNAVGVFVLAIGVALLAMLSVYLGLRLYIGEAAVFVVFALVPFMQMSVAWPGLFQPDMWAGMFTLMAVGLWLWRRFRAAMVVALVAGICRDLALSTLLVFALYAAYRTVRGNKEWRERTLWGVGLLGVFALVYITHVVQSAPYFPSSAKSGGRVAGLLRESISSGLVAKVLEPVSYQGFLWWLVYAPPIALVPAAAAGLVWALRRNMTALIPIVGLLAGWAAYLIVLGAHSSYWGLLFMPVVYAGAGALVACAATTACGRNPWSNSAMHAAK